MLSKEFMKFLSTMEENPATHKKENTTAPAVKSILYIVLKCGAQGNKA